MCVCLSVCLSVCVCVCVCTTEKNLKKQSEKTEKKVSQIQKNTEKKKRAKPDPFGGRTQPDWLSWLLRAKPEPYGGGRSPTWLRAKHSWDYCTPCFSVYTVVYLLYSTHLLLMCVCLSVCLCTTEKNLKTKVSQTEKNLKKKVSRIINSTN